MRILVTGGAGLIGSHCAEYYARKNAQVVVLDNLGRSELFSSQEKSVEHNWRYLKRYKNIERIKGDVRSKKDILRAMGKGVDVVVHAAGQPGVSSSKCCPAEDFDINALGTFNVLESLRKRCPQATFIYCSSNKVYGANLNKIPLCKLKTRYVYKNCQGVSEDFPLGLSGRMPYGTSKFVGDLYAQEYAYSYGIKTGIFRMGCVYGERQFGFEQQGWETWFTIAALTGKMVTIFGDGRQVRDLLYVTDVVEAYDKFIRSDKKCGVYNIGGGIKNTVSLLEFLKYLEEETGKAPKIRYKKWRQGDQKVYITDLRKIEKELKWQPKVGVRAGIKRIVKWVSENINYFK
ncbi:MAG: NAD-dependent epimerase/dehydratase family protein [Candidatus Omnitrophica bacterium]|nr:NAD-dependent epimerase/dehydratase family protein [Candidatus Omnitrophota bacterium]